MKAIILAGGFAVRLLPLTKHMPKPLLPVAGVPVIDYIVEKICQIPDVDQILVATNEYYADNFNYWLRGQSQNLKKIKVVCEGASSQSEKLGAIAALQYVIQTEGLQNEEVLVVAGDNIFEFSLVELVDYYNKLHFPVIALSDLSSRNRDELKLYGLGILDESQKIVGFQEKPLEPKSTYAATGCYVYPAGIYHYIQKYLDDKNNPDAPGYFIEWLYPRLTVQAFVSNQTWYDIGSIDSYDQVNQYFRNKKTLIKNSDRRE